MVSTYGVFEPAGYIHFDVDTGISSINGYYHATIEIEPVLSSDMKEKGIVWPVKQTERYEGWQWGSSMGGGTSKKFTFSTYLDIPDDPSLAGERIPIAFSAKVVFPGLTSIGTFDNFEKDISERIPISLNSEEGAVSTWDNFWLGSGMHGGRVIAVLMWLLCLGVVGLYLWLLGKELRYW
ncbi:hypothetical protein ACFLXT_04945 [Chloroflexota bacterium]